MVAKVIGKVDGSEVIYEKERGQVDSYCPLRP